MFPYLGLAPDSAVGIALCVVGLLMCCPVPLAVAQVNVVAEHWVTLAVVQAVETIAALMPLPTALGYIPAALGAPE